MEVLVPLDRVLERGERIELLVDKTERLDEWVTYTIPIPISIPIPITITFIISCIIVLAAKQYGFESTQQVYAAECGGRMQR